MYSFSKKKRLIFSHEYDYVFGIGKKITTRNFVFFYCKNDCAYARLGLAISKKKVNKSHDRQRIKRLVRESFRHRVLGGLDIVVLARHSIEKESNSSLLKQLGSIWDDLVGF